MASTYTIKNRANYLITVVMDTFREAHEIPVGKQSVFVKANPLDRPTFHVFKDLVENGKPNRDHFITSMKVSIWDAIRAEGKYVFDGNELD